MKKTQQNSSALCSTHRSIRRWLPSASKWVHAFEDLALCNPIPQTVFCWKRLVERSFKMRRLSRNLSTMCQFKSQTLGSPTASLRLPVGGFVNGRQWSLTHQRENMSPTRKSLWCHFFFSSSSLFLSLFFIFLSFYPNFIPSYSVISAFWPRRSVSQRDFLWQNNCIAFIINYTILQNFKVLLLLAGSQMSFEKKN